MRILGIDYGAKRIGLAVCDELEILARGIATVQSRGEERDLSEIGRYVREFAVGRIVVGYPYRLDGSRGIQCEKVDAFVEKLESAFPVPVERWDETLSTREAEDILAGRKVRAGKKRKVVDRIAACLILQDYLDRRGARKHGG
jgi:putative Holliday junction resolvase